MSKLDPLMTGYEIRIVKSLMSSRGDILKDDKMVNSVVRAALGTPIESTLEGGEAVNVNPLTKLVAARIGYELANPKDIDLEKWAKILGEQKIEQAVELRGADSLFGDIVVVPKEKKDE